MNKIKADMGGGRQLISEFEFPSNSMKSRERREGTPPEAKERPPEEKIVTGQVVMKQKGLWAKVLDSFVSGPEDRSGITEWVVMEIMVPAAKSMIVDSFGMIMDGFRDGIEKAIFGDTRARSRNDRPGSYFAYNRVARPSPSYSAITPRGRSTHDFGEIIFQTRGEAEDCLTRLRELIGLYGQATVQDLYDMAGITGDFVDVTWGWTDLRTAVIRHTRGGYIIALPRTHPLES